MKRPPALVKRRGRRAKITAIYKRMLRRLRRRLERRDPENAPTKRRQMIYGWDD